MDHAASLEHSLPFVAVLVLIFAACGGAAPGSSSSGAAAQAGPKLDTPALHEERVMAQVVDGQRLAYRLDVPPGVDAPAEGWPLLLFLHGAGERGTDLEQVGVHGPPQELDRIPELRRCAFVAPQCPTGSWWQAKTLKALLDEVRELVRVDDRRIYVTGLSMGGYGTWSLLANYPDLFAAAVPICGGGDIGQRMAEFETDFHLEGLLRARNVPIRTFHGTADDIIPFAESQLLVDALLEAGGNVELTAYPGVGHDSWTQTYADPGLYMWLFAQRRPER